MKTTDMDAAFNSVLDSLTDYPPEHAELIRELTWANEHVVAFEVLCQQVYEFHYGVTPAAVASLAAIGKSLDVDSGLVDMIWSEVSESVSPNPGRQPKNVGEG